MHTKDHLAQELDKAGLHDMASLAATGYYHDYLSPLDTPSLTLLADLTAADTPQARELRKRHINGEFDANLEESDDWAKSAEGQAAFRQLMRR